MPEEHKKTNSTWDALARSKELSKEQRHDLKMLQAWALAVAFNDTHSVGTQIKVKDQETQQENTLTTSTLAYVINDTPIVQCDRKQIKLSQIVS